MGGVRFLPVLDEKGIWVAVASILVVGVVMISLAAWIVRELPAASGEEEFRRTEALLVGLTRLQRDLQGIELGDVVNFQASISSGASSMYAPKLAGTLSTVDASQSAIRVIADTTRWDFEEGMWRSENGLSENIYIVNDPNRDDYGYITLDNNWYGNRFITKTHRTIDALLTAYEYSFSMRFVAPDDVTVSSASLFMYNSGNPQDPQYHAYIWFAYDDGHGRPKVGDDPKKIYPNRDSEKVPGSNVCDITVTNNSPLPAGTSGWVSTTTWLANFNATLTKGTVYHLVVDVSQDFGIEPNDWDYLAVAYTEPHNTVWKDNGVGNENRSVVLWTRETIDTNPHWTELYNAEPVFVLTFADGTNWGNPYHGAFKLYDESIYYPDIGDYGDNNMYNSYSDGENCYSAGVINSNSYLESDNIWGENFQILEDTTISAFEVPVDRHGLPTSDLYVYIENSTWSEGHMLKAADICSGDAPPPSNRFKIPIESVGTTGGTPAWYRITLDQPVTLAAGNHWIYLRTKGDTRYDYYRVPLDNTAGNGPYTLPVNMSWDNANSWAFRADMSDDEEELSGVVTQPFQNVDMPFRLILENYKENAMYTSPALAPGERVKWLSLTWDNDTPENTQVTVQVRVGDMVHPENPNLPDDPNYPWSEWENIQNGQDLGEVFGIDPFSGVDSRVANALQYRIMLSTDNKQQAPKVWNVQVRYYEGVGTTRPAVLEWVDTTYDDFASGGNENTNVFTDGYVGLGGWSVVSRAPFSSLNYGIATVGAGDNIYLINSQSGGGTVFWRYNVTSGTWASRKSPTDFGLIGVKNGTYMTWDNGNYIYCLVGGSGSDYSTKNRARHHFLRYDIANNTWTQLQGTYNTMSTSEPIGEEGAGDALAWVPGWVLGVGDDNFIYALTGGHNTAYYPTELSNGHFLRYSVKNNSWTLLDDNYPWVATENSIDGGTDDGASLVWAGASHLYALRGEYMEGTGSYDFASYDIFNYTWGTTISTPSSLWNRGAGGGTGDGAGLVWIGGDNIYAMSGGSCLEEERNIFSVYCISQDNWKQGPELPWGVTDTNGHRLASDNAGRIYAWRGLVNDVDIPELARFVPNTYPTSGRYTSAAIDAGESVDWKRVEFDKTEPSGTSLSLFEVSFSEDGVFDNEPWYQVDSGASLSENNSRYACYRATFTSDGTDTPRLLEVRLYYALTRIPFSTWTQTDWSGDNGLLAWDDLQPTRYYDNENVSSRINIGDLVLVPGSGDNVWGDNFRVEQVLSSDSLNDSVKRLSLRFRARRTEDIYGVRLYIEDYLRAQLAVNICRDNAGNPGENLTTENQVPISSTGWLYIGFSPIASLVEDNVYHIVVRMVPLTEWTQTDWSGGPTKPSLQVGTWSNTYDNFYDNENVDWRAGSVKLKQFAGSSYPPQNVKAATTSDNRFAEAYVNSAYPQNNYGGSITNPTYSALYVGHYGSGTERGYLKFDLSSIPLDKIIVSATLCVYQWGTSATSYADIQIERVDNDDWLEGDGPSNTGDTADPGELCWNYQPDRTGLLVPPLHVTGTDGVKRWYSWTSSALASFIEDEYAGDKVVSLALVDINENYSPNHSAAFDGKEFSLTYAPYLNVTYADIAYKNGWFESSIYDAGGIADWKAISWSESTLPGTTSIVVKARMNTTLGDNDPYDGGWSDWYQQSNGEENTSMPNGRYVQYRAELSTTDDTTTPALEDIRLCYGLLTAENFKAGSEPSTLVDGSSWVGAFLDSSRYENTWSQDGVYENLGEQSLGAARDNYVSQFDNVMGTVENFAGMQQPDGGYGTLKMLAVPPQVVENDNDNADSFVENFSPDSNNGTLTNIYVGRYQATWCERGYVKFDLSSIPSDKMIVQAKLWMYNRAVSGGGANVQVERVDDDSWTETGITWNNQPARTGLLAGSQSVSSGTTWYSWTSSTLTSFVAGEYAGNKVVSLALVDTQENNGVRHYANFASKEYSSSGIKYPPKLEITYENRVDIRMNVTGTPSAFSYALQIRYQLNNANDTFRLQVYDWLNGTYENRMDLTSTAWYENSYALNLAENERNVDNGDVRARFVDLASDVTSAADLRIDYLRVSNIPITTDNYRLNWEHRISAATEYDNYTLRIYGYNETADEDVGVYIRNFNTSSWEFIANMPAAAGWVTKFISGENKYNYLSGGIMSVRYFEDTTDMVQTRIHIDYVVLEAAVTIGSVALRVSSPLNENVAYDGCTPDNVNVLYSGDNGLNWTRRDWQPIYVVDADTNVNDEIHVPDSHEGNPYDDNVAYSIYGGSSAGVRFTVSGEVSGKSKVTRGAWVLVRRIGSPPSGLSYTLYNISEGRVLAQGTVENAPPDANWSWRYIQIENVFAEGENYRFYLSTADGNESNCYQWMSPGTSLNMTLTNCASYDGANTRGERNNVENLQRDVVFRFVVASSFSSSGELVSSVYDAGGIVIWHHAYWGESLSSGTSITAYLCSSEDGVSWSDWENVANYEMIYWENRYIQYRVVENTTDESTTPVLHDITIKYYNQAGAVAPPAPQPDSIVRTLVQTTTADFLADRAPDAVGENVEVVSPGDVTLMAENYWGNEFAATSGFPMSSRLDSENKLLAVRFVAEADENVENVKFLTLVCCDGTLRMPLDPLGAMANIYWDVLLVGDNNGVPNMENILGRGKGAAYKKFPQSPRSQGTDPSMEWYLPYPRLETDNFLVNPSNPNQHPWLIGGQTYHLVVTVNKAYAGFINRDNWIAVVSHRRDNVRLDYWINGDTYNTNRAVLFGDNRSGIYRWENSTTAGSPVEGCDPMYVLCVARGGSTWINYYEGNPYYKSDEEFYTNNYIGQTVPIPSTMKVGAIEFFMKGIGEGIGETYVGIGQGIAPMTKLTETAYSIPIDYASRYSWARFTLPAPYILSGDETYTIYIMSPSSTEYGYGAICAMKTPWETNTKGPYVYASYGGDGQGKDSSTYIWSYDGSTWDDKDYRDLSFRFVTGYRTSGSFTSGVLDAGQVVDWQYIEWDETRPAGTDIKLYVLAGGERYGPFSNRSSLENVPDSRYIRYEVEMTSNDSATSPALHEVRIAYRGGFGSLRIELQNQGEGRTLAYEGGAVIVKQEDRSTMYSMPSDMIVFTPIDDNRMELDVNYRLLRSTLSVKSAALTAMAGANFYMLVEARVVRENDNMRSVEIDIISDFAQAWYEYLRSVSDRINRTYPDWSTVTRPSEYEVKLVINESEIENRSIAYRETVREIEVQIL